MDDLLAFLVPDKEKILFVAARQFVLQCVQSPDPGLFQGTGRHLDEVDEMNWYGRFVESSINALERVGRVRALGVLESMDEDFLKEHGYSRELLHKGVSAWPWRVDQSSEQDEGAVADPLSLAEAELSAYTDLQQLDALGVGCDEVPDAVRGDKSKIDDAAA